MDLVDKYMVFLCFPVMFPLTGSAGQDESSIIFRDSMQHPQFHGYPH